MHSRLYKLLTGIVLSIGMLKSFLYLRVDPDAQHSGFVYAQAIAVSNGLLPNRDFLSPYGVTGPVLNGLWLKLTTDSLLSLLLFYGILTGLTGYLIQRISSRYVGRKIGILLNLIWVLTMATTIPWPSILSTFLSLISFTILIENLSKFRSSVKVNRIFLIPVVIALQISILTRIQLLLVPVLFSIYLLCNLKKVNLQIVRFWFGTNLVIGSTLIILLTVTNILPSYIDQAILWPLTEFSHPSFNLSWWFSFVWFPASSALLLLITYLGVKVFKTEKTYLGLSYIAIVVLIFSLFHFYSNMEFTSYNTNTLRTVPGLVKNASTNFQFILFYSSAMFLLAGIVYSLSTVRKSMVFEISRLFDLEHFIIMLMGFTGLSQLYPLRDNVHLWFVAPLLMVSASYYFRLIHWNKDQVKKSLVVILSSILFVQTMVLFKFIQVDRKPLTSYALRGLFSDSQHQLGIDKTMYFLDKNLTNRVLRNNCVDSLYSVARGKYVSVDGNFSSNSFGNFTDIVPIVDPSPNKPLYVLECRISNLKIQEILSGGATITFQSGNLAKPTEIEQYFDVLFRNPGIELVK